MLCSVFRQRGQGSGIPSRGKARYVGLWVYLAFLFYRAQFLFPAWGASLLNGRCFGVGLRRNAIQIGRAHSLHVDLCRIVVNLRPWVIIGEMCDLRVPNRLHVICMFSL